MYLTNITAMPEIKAYFLGILELSKQNIKFPVNFEDVWRLGYKHKHKAFAALRENFIEGEDYQLTQMGKVVSSKDIHNGVRCDCKLSVSCLEYFVVRKKRQVFEFYRQIFHCVAEPIYQEPAYQIPKSFTEALRLAADQQEQIEAQQRQIGMQSEQILQLSTTITSMEKKVTYMDRIFACPSTVKVTVIAQDYGMSAKAFNQLLHKYGLQYKCGEQWVLYAKYLPMGYVKDTPFTYVNTSGIENVKSNMQWTQKGRAFLYEFLKERGILPMIEQ